ncbi:MAG: undecaprenyl-diphosphate phosphatase [Candidatus Methylacidiphilales bacterium]|nr:undecaprenyl-diphosphate phosphatase [Candidatus Methylacidiphilales bacterium]
MPHWLETIVLGIIEGITEFLPISSTGHLIVAEHFFGSPRSEFFNVGIQSGAVLAVVLIYWRRLLDLGLRCRERETQAYLGKLALAFLLTVILGLITRKMGIKLPETLEPVAWAVLLGALGIFFAESVLHRRSSTDHIAWSTAALVGISQVIAGIFPGTSRSAATIIVAMLLGCSRLSATEFSFLVGIPTMFAASAYLALGEWKDRGPDAVIPELGDFALGFAVSLVTAFLVVKWLLFYLRSHDFRLFAWYRLALGIALLAWVYLA